MHTSSSSVPVQDVPSSSRNCPMNLDLVMQTLFRAGSTSFMFSFEESHLKLLMKAHGLRGEDLSLDLCEQALCYHLMSGLCAAIPADENLRRSACGDISGSCSSAKELELAISSIIMQNITSAIRTKYLRKVCVALNLSSDHQSSRRSLINALQTRHNYLQSITLHHSIKALFDHFENMRKPMLLSIAVGHGLSVDHKCTLDGLKNAIIAHVSHGQCCDEQIDLRPPHCESICTEFSNGDHVPDSTDKLKLQILKVIVDKFTAVPLRRILNLYEIPFDNNHSTSQLRRRLHKYIRTQEKGKYVERRRTSNAARESNIQNQLHEVRNGWPNMVSDNLKHHIHQMFREETSSERLAEFVCASCAESTLLHEREVLSETDFDLDLLQRPDIIETDRGDDDDNMDDSQSNFDTTFNWLDPECDAPELPYMDGRLQHLLLDPTGIAFDNHDRISLSLCHDCANSLRRGNVPALALANRTFLGHVPEQLKDLTPVEESMIALCRAKCCVVQLKEENEGQSIPFNQRGMKGHIIIYPQRPERIATVLPPTIDDIVTPICVIFVGSSPPTAEWLKEKAKPLSVRREKVRNALIWLKRHNQLYKDILIDNERLDRIPTDTILPFHVQHVLPNDAQDILTSRYDASVSLENDASTEDQSPDIPFQNVVITDVDGHAPSNELRAAAIRHVKKKGGAYVQIPHDPSPVNEFNNPALFPSIYPTLFPYGIGGFEDKTRKTRLSFKRHIKHLFNLSDRRFQEHYSFLFTAFNILQRRQVLLHTSLKVKKSNFDSVASKFALASPQAIHCVTERVSRGDFHTAKSDDEREVLKLMKEVQLVTSHVPGSSASRVAMRNEIRGLMMDLGLPSFYVTINPADVYNPLVKFLAGADIDIDNLVSNDVPKYREQSLLVAHNPSVAAKFFNIYMKAFISSVLAYNPKNKDIQSGILGVVKGYYGCVEAQGRGTLHCHMLIWVEGGLNPNEIRERVLKDDEVEFKNRLLAFLDDTISNCIPPDTDPALTIPASVYHPCSVRGIDLNTNPNEWNSHITKDLHYLVKRCQSHSHSKTCYKYWKGPPDPKECRFDLHENNACPESTIDTETGELCLRCLDGMVNNFNATILETMRCNMDIKFIGSGASAKAILYYITDYITKSQLKTHVAYAALELAVAKLEEYNPHDDDLTLRAKKLLQKCAHAMISHQELSAQQVCSYLMDFEDHFTSHNYEKLFWTSFEAFLNVQDPSPECNAPKNDDVNNAAPLQSQMEEDNNNQDHNDENEETNAQSADTEHNDDDEFEILNVDTNEVAICTDEEGNIVPRAGQVTDYCLRSPVWKNINLWDFIGRVEKVKLSSERQEAKSKETKTDLSDTETEDDCEQEDNCETEPNSPDKPSYSSDDMSNLLSSSTRTRPRCDLHATHPESSTHFLWIRKPQINRVVVPIGLAIPRRDQEKIYPQYCRLMLMLFKPWLKASDLRTAGQTWSEAFEQFQQNCPQKQKDIMNNMQILHECKDSRDDHFKNRRTRNRTLRVSEEIRQSHHAYDNFAEGDQQEILEHLNSIENCRSDQINDNNSQLLQCLTDVESCGLYKINRENNSCNTTQIIQSDDFEERVDPHTVSLEPLWQTTYENRRNNWKKAIIETSNNTHNTDPTNTNNDGIMSPEIVNNILSQNNNTNTFSAPTIRQDIKTTDADRHVDIDEIIATWTLNADQARAFKIIAEHSLSNRPDQLRMYLGGAAGTGKSRVINALKDFFVKRGQVRRFRLASYMGVAAQNISGMTIHSALCMNQKSGTCMGNKTQ